MMNFEECDVGKLSRTECHLNHFSNEKILYSSSELCEEEFLLLHYRIENFTKSNNICKHHKLRYLDYYSEFEKRCCNPFHTHNKIITGYLRPILLDTCEKFNKHSNTQLIPGKKVCTNCLTKINGLLLNATQDYVSTEQESTPSSENNVHSPTTSSQMSTETSTYSFGSQSRKRLAAILEVLDIHPLKKEKLSKNRLEKKAFNLMNDIHEKVLQTVEKSFDVQLPNVDMSFENVNKISSSFNQILTNIKNKFEETLTIKEKLKILLLLPENWNFVDVTEHLNCTRYMFNQIQKLREKKELNPNVIRQRGYCVDVRQSIIDYYLDQKNCYICPGTKQYLTVRDQETGEKVQHQKRLLLYTVKELYKNWKEENSELNKLPSLSFFKMLRPKECVSAGDPGTHTICVCVAHENIKLKLFSLKTNLSYRDLLQKAVCCVDNEDCMLGRCRKCPDQKGLSQFIEQSSQIKDDEVIEYKTWSTKSIEGNKKSTAMSLQSVSQTSVQFIQDLSKDVKELTKHHFTAESQKNYLVSCKENLECDTCIVLMDFSENYAFKIQRSVQAYYFNNDNTQATVHPFVMYIRTENEKKLKVISFCVISDSTQHTASTIYAFQEKFTHIIKTEFPAIKNIIYFSDGAPTQYKNKNNFANMCLHEKDFGLKIKSYNFFATSHGKSPCDAIGGVAKREITKISLRRPPNQQITNAKGMFDTANKEIKGIRFLWVSSSDIISTEKKLKKVYNKTKTIDGTRSYHCCIPIENNTLQLKSISSGTTSSSFKIF